jgi:hypothetical protein
LAKILNVSQSLIHYVISGKSNVAFNTMVTWISELGYSIKGNKIEINQFKYVSSPFYLINLVNKQPYDGQWLDISVSINNILQNSQFMTSNIFKINLSKMIINRKWKSFYCGVIEYLFQTMFKKTPPKWTNIKAFKLDEQWSPLENYANSTDYDPIFSKYNILIPIGELQCL